MRTDRIAFLPQCLLLAAASCVHGGCSSGGNSTSVMIMRKVDADQVAAAAMATYDENKNGSIDGGELDLAKSLKSALVRIDTNRDGAIAADELAARIRILQTQPDVVPCVIQLKKGAKNVASAQVTLEPEPFLGANFPKYNGSSDATGIIKLQAEDPTVPGVVLGFYKVHVSGPATGELGIEIAADALIGGRAMTLTL